MDKYQQVIMDYAVNRLQLKDTNMKIHDLNTETDWKIDLSGFRAAWYDQDYAWGGWLAALNDYDDGYSEEEGDLAELLDERTRIKKEAGQLKRNMCAYGRALIKGSS